MVGPKTRPVQNSCSQEMHPQTITDPLPKWIMLSVQDRMFSTWADLLVLRFWCSQANASQAAAIWAEINMSGGIEVMWRGSGSSCTCCTGATYCSLLPTTAHFSSRWTSACLLTSSPCLWERAWRCSQPIFHGTDGSTDPRRAAQWAR